MRRKILPIVLAAGAFAASPALSAPKPHRAAAIAEAPARVDPQAVQAVLKMSAYLRTLQMFEVTSDAAVEDVIDDRGAKITTLSHNLYRVRRPDGFYVETASDRQVRRFYYDGKTFTVAAPRAGFYAHVPAPPTIQQTLDEAYADYGIALPLADLFYWGVEDPPPGTVREAIRVGYAKIAGVDTDQYMFRSRDLEWQIWIQRGPEPVPRKVVIVTLDDPARPSFAADLTWNTKARFGPETFAYAPPQDAKPVLLAHIGK